MQLLNLQNQGVMRGGWQVWWGCVGAAGACVRGESEVVGVTRWWLDESRCLAALAQQSAHTPTHTTQFGLRLRGCAGAAAALVLLPAFRLILSAASQVMHQLSGRSESVA